MRLISFALTEPQILAGTKTVTRRLGWLHAKPRMRLMGVRKAMGLKPGEKIVRLRQIRIDSVRREPLRALTNNVDYGFEETTREGYPDDEHRSPKHFPSEFVYFFCAAMGCEPDDVVTRIAFRYHIQRACPRCTQGVMDSTNDHLRGLCVCQCHDGDCYGCNVRSTETDDHDCVKAEE